MNKAYSFLSDSEPTKEQLDKLMLAVSHDVKARADKANADFRALQAHSLEQALTDWQNRKKQLCTQVINPN